MDNREKKRDEKKYIEWKGFEHEYNEKSSDWLWVTAIITMAIFFASVILDNILFGLIILLGGFTLTLHATKKPEMINFKIGPRGIQIKDRFFDYTDLESFWLNYRENKSHTHKNGEELIIKSKKTLSPILTIMTGDADPDEIEDYLSDFLTIEKVEKPLSMVIMEMLKI